MTAPAKPQYKAIFDRQLSVGSPTDKWAVHSPTGQRMSSWSEKEAKAIAYLLNRMRRRQHNEISVLVYLDGREPW